MGYIVARANGTALPFVARADRWPVGNVSWEILSRHATYASACAALAVALGGPK